MRGFSPKSIIYAIFVFICVAVIGGCIMDPVGVGIFTEDDLGGTVTIHPDSDPGFSPGNGKISNLDPNKYYKVEEWSSGGVAAGGVKFVTSGGTLTENLTNIGRARSGVLSGLRNGHIYKINYAEPLTTSVTYTYYTGGGGSTLTPDSKGLITIAKPSGNDLLILTPSLGSTYKAVEIPVNPAGYNSLWNGVIAKSVPAGGGMEIDYVFYDEGTKNFYFLKVYIEGDGITPPEPDEGLVITIVPYIHPTDPTFTFTPTPIPPFSQAAAIGGTLSFSITVTTTPFSGGIDGWYYGGTKVSSTASLTSATAASEGIDFTVLGDYEFTFVGFIGSVPYSGTYTIKIIP